MVCVLSSTRKNHTQIELNCYLGLTNLADSINFVSFLSGAPFASLKWRSRQVWPWRLTTNRIELKWWLRNYWCLLGEFLVADHTRDCSVNRPIPGERKVAGLILAHAGWMLVKKFMKIFHHLLHPTGYDTLFQVYVVSTAWQYLRVNSESSSSLHRALL